MFPQVARSHAGTSTSSFQSSLWGVRSTEACSGCVEPDPVRRVTVPWCHIPLRGHVWIVDLLWGEWRSLTGFLRSRFFWHQKMGGSLPVKLNIYIYINTVMFVFIPPQRNFIWAQVLNILQHINQFSSRSKQRQLRLSVVKMEAILQEALSKCYAHPPSECPSLTNPGQTISSPSPESPKILIPDPDGAQCHLATRRSGMKWFQRYVAHDAI